MSLRETLLTLEIEHLKCKLLTMTDELKKAIKNNTEVMFVLLHSFGRIQQNSFGVQMNTVLMLRMYYGTER